MTKRRKIWLSCLLLVVIVAMAVSPSLAYLTATTDPVVNVFSPSGTISATLDEEPVDSNGHGTDGDRVKENEYTYVAGAVLDKDPTVHILAGSVDCWVYVCVENQLPSEYFTLNIQSSAWQYVDSQTTYVDGIATVSTVYRYYTNVYQSDEVQTLTPVFTNVTVSNYLTEELAQAIGERTVIVETYAIQLDGIDQDLADELAVGFFFDGTDPNSVLTDEQLAALTATEPPEDTATPEPSPTATATATATAAPTPEPEAAAEATPAPTAEPTATPEVTPTPTPEATPTPTPEVTPTPTPEAEVETDEVSSDEEGLSSAILVNK